MTQTCTHISKMLTGVKTKRKQQANRNYSLFVVRKTSDYLSFYGQTIYIYAQ